jgi:hypothetical protein
MPAMENFDKRLRSGTPSVRAFPAVIDDLATL